MDDGDVWIPMSIHEDGIVGDGMVWIEPDDPQCELWKDHVEPLAEHLKRFVPSG